MENCAYFSSTHAFEWEIARNLQRNLLELDFLVSIKHFPDTLYISLTAALEDRFCRWISVDLCFNLEISSALLHPMNWIKLAVCASDGSAFPDSERFHFHRRCVIVGNSLQLNSTIRRRLTDASIISPIIVGKQFPRKSVTCQDTRPSNANS